MSGRVTLNRLLRWATLTACGLLGYALVRALLTIISLGAPLYDWQWYVWLAALITISPAYLALRLPRTRAAISAFLLVILLTGIGFDGFGQTVHLHPDPDAAAPVLSFWAFSDLGQYPEAVLHDVQAAGGRLYMWVSPEALANRRELIDGIRRLGRNGIDVYLVPPVSDFLSVPVYREWISNTHEVLALARHEGLSNVRGVIGDAEAPMGQPLDILSRDHAAFGEASGELSQFIYAAHEAYPGVQIGVTANWLQYADALDGDADLALLMRSPVDPPGNWDFVNLMTYSSYFPPEWRAYYVYIHERSMAARYPSKNVSHLVGLVGGGFPWEPLLDFDSLVRDARLSRATGVREIVVFQLEGALKTFGNDFVRRFSAAVNHPETEEPVDVPFSRPASLLLYGVSVADALLDVRGPVGLLWFLWGIASAALIYRNPAQLR